MEVDLQRRLQNALVECGVLHVLAVLHAGREPHAGCLALALGAEVAVHGGLQVGSGAAGLCAADRGNADDQAERHHREEGTRHPPIIRRGIVPLMRTLIALTCLAVLAAAAPQPAGAQDLVIVNARILDGKGGVIERGSVVVRDGKIVSVAAALRRRLPARSGSMRRAGRSCRASSTRIGTSPRAIRRSGWRKRRRTADAGVPRRRLHHRAVRDLSRSGDRAAAADRVRRGEGAAPVRRPDHSAGPAGAPPGWWRGAIRRASTRRGRRGVRRRRRARFPRPRRSRPSRRSPAGSTTTSRRSSRPRRADRKRRR